MVGTGKATTLYANNVKINVPPAPHWPHVIPVEEPIGRPQTPVHVKELITMMELTRIASLVPEAVLLAP